MHTERKKSIVPFKLVRRASLMSGLKLKFQDDEEVEENDDKENRSMM
jgi:hypothetical protein